MPNLINPRIIKFKGLLFLLLGILSSILLLSGAPSLRNLLLLIISIWSFCRFYYFAFYVIQHYVDPGYRFAGLVSFAQYLYKERRRKHAPPDADA